MNGIPKECRCGEKHQRTPFAFFRCYAKLCCKLAKLRSWKSLSRREGTIRRPNTGLYWVNQFRDGNLAIMAAPRSLERLDAAILTWKNDGIDCVVSLVENSEMPGLIEAEAALCQEFGIAFQSFPIRDKSIPPSLEDFVGLVRRVADEISLGRAVAIHCRAGIGRSATLAACVLIWLGVNAEVALDMIAEARGIEVPETEAQRQWILKFSDVAPN